MSSPKQTFTVDEAFCDECGAILPFFKQKGEIGCYYCKKKFKPSEFGDSDTQYTINFNIEFVKKKETDETEEKKEEGPVVERKCPKCDNDKMSYATLQLRSADEGQTVFYTCTSCNFKESENS